MTLRAKIDLAAATLICATVLYRIRYAHHHDRATNGAFIPCTISHTRSRMHWRGVTHTLLVGI
jgi:hypothetical protein